MARLLRTEMVQSRITRPELKKLKRAADKANQTVSDFIRERIQIAVHLKLRGKT